MSVTPSATLRDTESPLRRAVFGGSFDPPHIGHVLAVQYVLLVGAVDAVTVVPVHSHAFSKDSRPFKQRMTLTRAAFAHLPAVEVSPLEQTLPAPSYTVQTLEALKKEHPDDQLRLLVGADVLQETYKWHRWDDVQSLAPPLVLGRAGINERGAPPALLPEVSSSELRRLLCDTQSLDARRRAQELLPRSVWELIEAEGLYTEASDE